MSIKGLNARKGEGLVGVVELTAGNVDAGVRELDRTRMKWRERVREKQASVVVMLLPATVSSSQTENLWNWSVWTPEIIYLDAIILSTQPSLPICLALANRMCVGYYLCVWVRLGGLELERDRHSWYRYLVAIVVMILRWSHPTPLSLHYD